jgi:non-canonical (house-cleaning) NTP pyrophosphatase
MSSKESGTVHVKVAVGSKNPVKLSAAKFGAEKAVRNMIVEDGTTNDVICEGFEVPCGVSDQPIGDIETKLGAVNRARGAFEKYVQKYNLFPDFSIGLEGGVALTNEFEQSSNQMECFAWIAVFDGDHFGLSRTASFFIPPVMRDLIMVDGLELGAADDKGASH